MTNYLNAKQFGVSSQRLSGNFQGVNFGIVNPDILKTGQRPVLDTTTVSSMETLALEMKKLTENFNQH